MTAMSLHTLNHFIVGQLQRRIEMVPKGKQTSMEIRKLVLSQNQDGKSVREIAKIVKRSHSTVQDIISRYKNENRIQNVSRKGQGKKLDKYD